MDECDDLVDQPIEAADGTATTIGATDGITEEDCPDMPVFFTGSNSPMASAHDLAAIMSNPAWLELSYASGNEKEAAGQGRQLERHQHTLQQLLDTGTTVR